MNKLVQLFRFDSWLEIKLVKHLFSVCWLTDSRFGIMRTDHHQQDLSTTHTNTHTHSGPEYKINKHDTNYGFQCFFIYLFFWDSCPYFHWQAPILSLKLTQHFSLFYVGSFSKSFWIPIKIIFLGKLPTGTNNFCYTLSLWYKVIILIM